MLIEFRNTGLYGALFSHHRKVEIYRVENVNPNQTHPYTHTHTHTAEQWELIMSFAKVKSLVLM